MNYSRDARKVSNISMVNSCTVSNKIVHVQHKYTDTNIWWSQDRQTAEITKIVGLTKTKHRFSTLNVSYLTRIRMTKCTWIFSFQFTFIKANGISPRGVKTFKTLSSAVCFDLLHSAMGFLTVSVHCVFWWICAAIFNTV